MSIVFTLKSAPGDRYPIGRTPAVFVEGLKFALEDGSLLSQFIRLFSAAHKDILHPAVTPLRQVLARLSFGVRALGQSPPTLPILGRPSLSAIFARKETREPRKLAAVRSDRR
jgi:hypothetical protein